MAGRHFIGGDRVVGSVVEVVDESFVGVIDMVDGVDLSVFEGRYRADGSGGRPYDPRLMVVAVVWCAGRGWRSPSRVARACRELVVLRDWFGDRVPGLSTIRRFVLGHHAAWAALFPQVLGLGARVGLVDASVTATDGTVLGSPGSLRGELTPWQIRLRIDQVRQELAAVQADNAAAAQALDGDGGDDAVLDAFVAQVCVRARSEEERLARRLHRLLAAEQVTVERAAAAGGDARVAALDARLARQQATLATMSAAQQDKCDRHAAVVAAYPHGAGRAPKPPHEYATVIRQQALIAGTQKN